MVKTQHSILASAKVNLSLHITGRRHDGYHLLDSLVVFADYGDELVLVDGSELSLDVLGPFSQGVPADQRNLVWKAAVAAGWSGHINLNKRLPHGAGIGGGSSDAAAVLAAIGADLPPDALLALGADLPVCLAGKAIRMQGIGEQLTPVSLPPLYAVLVNPGVHIPTAAIFKALEVRNNAPMPDVIPQFVSSAECADWLWEQRNDLESVACSQAPVIERLLCDLNDTSDALLARMSGSGSTCFALYPSKKAAQKAAYEIGTEHAHWWCATVTLS